MLKRMLVIAMFLFPFMITTHAQELTRENFKEILIPYFEEDGNGNLISTKFFKSGDSVSFNLTIEPKTDDDATKIDGRKYEFYNYLDDPSIVVGFWYRDQSGGQAGGIPYNKGDDYLEITVGDALYGLHSISVKVSGKAPAVEGRIENVVALKIKGTEIVENALPLIIIQVVNNIAFESSISSLETKVNELNSKVLELENLGVAVGVAKQKIKTAQDYIDDGKNYYDQGKYLEANSSLTKAEEYLNEAENELFRLDVNYRLAQAEDKLDEFLEKISELDAATLQAKEKGISTTAYDIKLQQFKTKYNSLYNRIEVNAKDYIDNGLYDDAKTTIESVVNEVDQAIAEVNGLISEIKAQIPEEIPTPTPTPTPTPSEPFYSGIVEYFQEKRDVILLYGGLLAGIVVLGFVAYRVTKIYMKRRKWDELK